MRKTGTRFSMFSSAWVMTNVWLMADGDSAVTADKWSGASDGHTLLSLTEDTGHSIRWEGSHQRCFGPENRLFLSILSERASMVIMMISLGHPTASQECWSWAGNVDYWAASTQISVWQTGLWRIRAKNTKAILVRPSSVCLIFHCKDSQQGKQIPIEYSVGWGKLTI